MCNGIKIEAIMINENCQEKEFEELTFLSNIFIDDIKKTKSRLWIKEYYKR